MSASLVLPALRGWRPHDPHEWARQITGLGLATRGALLALADSMWLSKIAPCAVLDDDREIATACGARLEWAQDARLRDEIRSVLEPHPEKPGYLTWTWLLQLWHTQLEAHRARQRAGSKGGKRKALAASGQQELPIVESVPATSAEASEPSDDPPEHGAPIVAMPSNARQSKSKRRELLFSAPRREKQLSPPSTREDVAVSDAPPAFVASDARGAPSPEVAPPAPATPPMPGDPPSHRLTHTRHRPAPDDAETPPPMRLYPGGTRHDTAEPEYYARQRRVLGAPLTSLGSIDWRSGLLDATPHAVGVA